GGATILGDWLTKGGPTGFVDVIGATLIVQLVLALIFLCAATRALRAADRAAFNLPLSLVLLTVWGVTTWLGIRCFRPAMMLFREVANLPTLQLLTSVGVFIFVSLLPTAVAARSAMYRRAGFEPFVHSVWARFAGFTPALLVAGTLILLFELVRLYGN